MDDLDRLYDRIDNDLLAGQFDKVDGLLQDLDPSSMSLTHALGWLTITYAAKDKLPHRARFYERAVTFARRTGQLRPGLFDGLG
jgi:hypothetical protein